jgi:DNA topoisomerase VI subunit B
MMVRGLFISKLAEAGTLLTKLLFCLATEIHQSVKRALQSCCQQLRTHLLKRNALKDAKSRKSKLIKYVPDVSRSLFGLLDGMRKRKQEQTQESTPTTHASAKRLRLNSSAASQMILRLDSKEVTEDAIRRCLTEAIDANNPDLDVAASKDAETVATSAAAVPLYIIPLYNLDDPSHDIQTPLFTFRPILPFQSITLPLDAKKA